MAYGEHDEHVHRDVAAQAVRVATQRRDAEDEADRLGPCPDHEADKVLALVAELVCPSVGLWGRTHAR